MHYKKIKVKPLTQNVTAIAKIKKILTANYNEKNTKI